MSGGLINITLLCFLDLLTEYGSLTQFKKKLLIFVQDMFAVKNTNNRF